MIQLLETFLHLARIYIIELETCEVIGMVCCCGAGDCSALFGCTQSDAR